MTEPAAFSVPTGHVPVSLDNAREGDLVFARFGETTLTGPVTDNFSYRVVKLGSLSVFRLRALGEKADELVIYRALPELPTKVGAVFDADVRIGVGRPMRPCRVIVGDQSVRCFYAVSLRPGDDGMFDWVKAENIDQATVVLVADAPGCP